MRVEPENPMPSMRLSKGWVVVSAGVENSPCDRLCPVPRMWCTTGPAAAARSTGGRR